MSMGRVITSLAELVRGTPATGQMPRWTATGAIWHTSEYVYLSRSDILPDTGADLTTAIQAVITANPGKKILFDRAGIYLVNTITTSTLKWCLSVDRDDTILEGVDGAELKTTSDAALAFFAGPARNGAGFTNWVPNRFYPNLTVYALTGAYAQGVASLTLAAPAEAANFAAGDRILIRTGQLVDNGVNDYQPDAEVNEVVSANASTGVVVLRAPTRKPYAQEYFITGAHGPTSTSATANLAPYGVSNVTAVTLRNVGFRNLRLTATALSTQLLWDAYQVDNFIFDHNVVTTNKSNGNPYFICNTEAHANTVIFTGTGALWWFAVGATGQTNVQAHHFTVRGGVGCVAFLHAHEGHADCSAHHNDVACGGDAALDANAVSLRARGYRFAFTHNTLRGASQFNGVFGSDATTGGALFDHNILDWAAPNAASLGGANQKWGANNLVLQGAVALRGNTGVAIANGTTALGVEALQGWVSDDNTTAVLGTLPAYATVLAVYAQTTEAFNSDSTDVLEVGYDADHDYLAVAFSVALTGVRSTIERPPLTFHWTPGSVDDTIWVFDKPGRIAAVSSVPRVAGSDLGAVNLDLTKCAGGGIAPASGTTVLTATINLKATADTVITSGITANETVRRISTGERLAAKFTGTLTAAVGMTQVFIDDISKGAGWGYQATERVIKGYYTAGGSAPTTGRVHVTVLYSRALREVV